MSDSRQSQVLGVSISLMILPMPFVGFRVLSRRLKKVSLGLDDWVLFWALFIHVVSCIVLVVAATAGNLGSHEIIGPDHLPVVTPRHTTAFHMVYVSQILTYVSDGSTKISILLLYSRIFVYRTFRIVTTAWIVIMLAWKMSFTFATIFQCNPISTFWTQPLAFATRSRCIDILSFYLAGAVSDLITDVMVLALPVPAVMRLQATLARKAAIAGIFLLGCIVLIFGALRVQDFFETNKQTAVSADLSYLIPQTFYWTLAETSVGIVCACLPTIIPAFNPKIEGSITHSLIPLLTRRSSNSSSRNDVSGQNTIRGGQYSKRLGSESFISDTRGALYTGAASGTRWTSEVISMDRHGVASDAERGIVVTQDVHVSKS